jgi:adenosylmethionine-8-amino-7-oxononanoate aminotransferase
MAEIVGTVASVTQLVQLSGALLAGGYSFLSNVARAPSEIRGLLTETAAVNSFLAQLQQIADSVPKNASEDALQALERVGVFQECQTILKSIEKALAKCEQDNGQDARNLGKEVDVAVQRERDKGCVAETSSYARVARECNRRQFGVSMYAPC